MSKNNSNNYVSFLSPPLMSYNIRNILMNDKLDKNEMMLRIENLLNSTIIVKNNMQHDFKKTISSKDKINKDDIVDVVAIDGTMCIVRLDDSGQTYFIDHAKGNSIESINCGSFNTDYMDVIEYEFGNTLNCEHYKNQTSGENCAHRDCKGYCVKCKYYDVKEALRKELISLGIMDRRGDITPEFNCLLKLKEEEKEEDY